MFLKLFRPAKIECHRRARSTPSLGASPTEDFGRQMIGSILGHKIKQALRRELWMLWLLRLGVRRPSLNGQGLAVRAESHAGNQHKLCYQAQLASLNSEHHDT